MSAAAAWHRHRWLCSTSGRRALDPHRSPGSWCHKVWGPLAYHTLSSHTRKFCSARSCVLLKSASARGGPESSVSLLLALREADSQAREVDTQLLRKRVAVHVCLPAGSRGPGRVAVHLVPG